MDQEEQVIICARRTSDTPPDGHVPGTSPIEGNCGHPLWIAPSGLLEGHRLHEEGYEVTYYCMGCGLARMIKAGAITDLDEIKGIYPALRPDEVQLMEAAIEEVRGGQ